MAVVVAGAASKACLAGDSSPRGAAPGADMGGAGGLYGLLAQGLGIRREVRFRERLGRDIPEVSWVFPVWGKPCGILLSENPCHSSMRMPDPPVSERKLCSALFADDRPEGPGCCSNSDYVPWGLPCRMHRLFAGILDSGKVRIVPLVWRLVILSGVCSCCYDDITGILSAWVA